MLKIRLKKVDFCSYGKWSLFPRSFHYLYWWNSKNSKWNKIFANCHLTGNTEIKENCEIGPNSLISDSTIGEGSKVLYSVVDGSDIESNGQIGPYAHLRTGSSLGDNVKVGAFAETKIQK